MATASSASVLFEHLHADAQRPSVVKATTNTNGSAPSTGAITSTTTSTTTSSGNSSLPSWLNWGTVGLAALAAGVGLGMAYLYRRKRQQKKTEEAASCCCGDSEEKESEPLVKKEKVPLEYLKDSQVVVINYQDLLRDDLDFSEPLEAAYGFEGLGILAVRGVPRLPDLRQKLLPLAHRFANLPEQVKEKYMHKESAFSFGWSHGKEQLDGKPDFSKGSYYNNPTYDEPFTDPKIIAKYPSFACPNIWPKDDLPELEPAFKNLGQLVVDVGMLLATHCDEFVHKKAPSYPRGKLHNIIKNCRTTKARLLHYFPHDDVSNNKSTEAKEENADDFGSWCGWHNDHGSLTGLVPAMYISKEGQEVPNPDPENAGLYIRSRLGKTIKAVIPSDHLAFQMGETEQIHSGGILRATPHCVRAAHGPKATGVSRETLAVFMEPMWDEPMNIPDTTTEENAKYGSSKKFMPPGVPPLEARWTGNNMSFGDFTKKTIEVYTVY